MPQVGPPLIEVRRFSFSFGDRPVLRDISLEIHEGEYVSIIGPNGAGKSTLLKCLVRILRGGSGTIRIARRDLGRYRQRQLARRVGYVPQADGLHVPYTVWEFVMMGRYPYIGPFGSPARRDETAVRHALSLTRMEAFADRAVATLSGGECQKVLIAAAVAQEPRILLLDEPTTFLDPLRRAEITEILQRLNRRDGLTIVAVTHDVNHAVFSSDRILALREGRVVSAGPPEEILEGHVLERLYGRPFTFTHHPGTGKRFVVPD